MSNETAPVKPKIENVMTQGRTLTSGGGNAFQGASGLENVEEVVVGRYAPKIRWVFDNPGRSRSSSGVYAPLHAAMNT